MLILNFVGVVRGFHGLIDPHHRTPSRGVDFESFFGRFRVATRKRPGNDSKTTEKRLEIDSPGGGSVVGSMSRGNGL